MPASSIMEVDLRQVRRVDSLLLLSEGFASGNRLIMMMMKWARRRLNG